MEVLHARCCGLDVHKKMVVGCLMVSSGEGKPQKEIRTFGTMTDDLLQLADWLEVNGCTHVAMESTGVYWKPVFNLLEGIVEVILVNAQHMKAVPGRKTDVKDCEWIADLLRHGLLKASFIPPEPIRELRDLTRYRKAMIRERSSEVNRLQKVLETANIKLRSVASDVLGVSGRAMVEALIEGNTDTKAMAELAKGHLKEKRGELERALRGRVQDHHRFLLAEQLCHLDYLDESIERVNGQIEEHLRPFAEAVEQLDTITGVGSYAAQVMVAEIGVDMSVFPSHRHLASWAGLCPGNYESAGKRKNGKIRKGNAWLREMLVEAALAASRTKNTYLSAQYHRLAARRGKKKAAVAVAHSILVIAYYILKRREPYRELGGDYFDQRDRQALQKRLIKRLESLGLKVTVEAMEVIEDSELIQYAKDGAVA